MLPSRTSSSIAAYFSAVKIGFLTIRRFNQVHESCVERRISDRQHIPRSNRYILDAASAIVQHDPTIGQIAVKRPKVPDAKIIATSDVGLENIMTALENAFGDTCDANVDRIDEYKNDGDRIATSASVAHAVAK